MTRLIDIKGFWDMYGRDDHFNDRDMWNGKILLYDDGWFEGIANDLNSPYKGDRMIFGIYHPGKVIELLKVSPLKVSDPFVFSAKHDDYKYFGTFSVLSLFGGKILCGTTLMFTQDVQLLKDDENSKYADRNIEEEKKDLEKRLVIFKENNDFPELYENTLGMRPNLSEYILRRYNGEKFTKEQCEELLEPVHDKVEEDTKKAFKKLIRNMQQNSSDLDDDDDDYELPFK